MEQANHLFVKPEVMLCTWSKSIIAVLPNDHIQGSQGGCRRALTTLNCLVLYIYMCCMEIQVAAVRALDVLGIETTDCLWSLGATQNHKSWLAKSNDPNHLQP